MITQEILKSLFIYDPETGIFTRARSASSNARNGQNAGWINNHGYLSIKINGKCYKCQRLAWLYMTGEWPKGVIDHINRDRKDNRFCNLRDTSVAGNNRNAGLRKDNISGIPGITWHKRDKVWEVKPRICGKQKYIGSTTSLADAKLMLLESRKAIQ